MTIAEALAKGYRWVGINNKIGTADDPETGDVLMLLDPQGHAYSAKVLDGASGDIEEPGPSRPVGSTSRKAGADTYPSADEVAPAAPAWAKKHYDAVRTSPGVTAQDMDKALGVLQGEAKTATKAGAVDDNTLALARSAAQKLAARRANPKLAGPTQAELAAYNKVQPSTGGGSEYAFPVPNYNGPIGPHHAGNVNGAVDLFAKPGTPVVSAVSGAVTRAGPFGAAGQDILIAGDDGRTYDYEHIDGLLVKPGDRVTAGQPLAAVATLDRAGASVGPAPHLHFAVGQGAQSIDYGNHGTANDFDTLGFLTRVHAGNGLGDNPLAFPSAPTVHNVGNGKLVAIDPVTHEASVIFDSPEPQRFSLGHKEYMYDPATKKATVIAQDDLAIQKDQAAMKGKFWQAMDQYATTVKSIKDTYVKGDMSTGDMQKYIDLAGQVRDTAIAGTTIWEQYKYQQQEKQKRAEMARTMLDAKVEQGSSMAKSLVQSALTALVSSKATNIPADTLSHLFEGGMQTADTGPGPTRGQLSDILMEALQAPQSLTPGIPGAAPSPAPAGPPAGPAPSDITPWWANAQPIEPEQEAA